MNKELILNTNLTHIVHSSVNPILAWSGGKDSTLLLWKLKSLNLNIPVLVFPHFWSEYQLEFIKQGLAEYKIQAFFYAPTRVDVKERSIIARYTFGKIHMPVIFDKIPNDAVCGVDKIRQSVESGPVPHFIWDMVITGTKKADTHELMPNLDLSEFDNVVAPLWDWTDEEVLEAIEKNSIKIDPRVYIEKEEKADTGNFVGCLACIGVEETHCPKIGEVIKGVNYGT